MKLFKRQGYWEATFNAMGSPCVLLTEETSSAKAQALLRLIHDEACRIEKKFSRYRSDNIIHTINHAHGKTITVDEETAHLLDYANACYHLSDGLFDITSGLLRKVWHFGVSRRLGSLPHDAQTPGTKHKGALPRQDAIEALLPFIGWEKVTWVSPQLTMPMGMEIDLGGIGKEYAVDRSAQLIRSNTAHSFVVNYGGDMFINGLRQNKEPWRIGIENPRADNAGSVNTALPALMINLHRGGIATSGDAHRFIEHQGMRYGHILNPRTGWPTPHAPQSVTVCADSCLEAGMLSTMAMLKGAQAEMFLKSEGVKHRVIR